MLKIVKMTFKSKHSNSYPDFVIKDKGLSKSKHSQVWVETAVYTLIGLSLIAVIISMATPQIQKIKDKTIIEQTISAMNVLDDKILEVQQSEGRIGKVVFKIAKGRLEINSVDNSIKYIFEDTKLELSEPGVEIKQGNIILKTEKSGARFNIILLMKYNIDITNKNNENTKTLQEGATPYNILIENKGSSLEPGATTQIDFEII
jgi:type II secretory pathway pseudopilin PulG